MNGVYIQILVLIFKMRMEFTSETIRPAMLPLVSLC